MKTLLIGASLLIAHPAWSAGFDAIVTAGIGKDMIVHSTVVHGRCDFERNDQGVSNRQRDIHWEVYPL